MINKLGVNVRIDKWHACFFNNLSNLKSLQASCKDDNYRTILLLYTHGKQRQTSICCRIIEEEIETEIEDEDDLYKVFLTSDGEIKEKLALKKLENSGQTTMMDKLKEIDLGTEEDLRPTFNSALLLYEKVEVKALS